MVSIGCHEAFQHRLLRSQGRGIGDQNPDRLVLDRGRVIAARDHADLSLIDEVEAERRSAPANVNLAGHHLRQCRRRAAGGDRFGLKAVLLDEGGDDRVSRRAGGRICDRLAAGVLQSSDRRIRAHIPVQIGPAGHLGADDAQRRPFGECAEHSH